MSGLGKPAVPMDFVEVSDAAEMDVPALKPNIVNQPESINSPKTNGDPKIAVQ